MGKKQAVSVVFLVGFGWIWGTFLYAQQSLTGKTPQVITSSEPDSTNTPKNNIADTTFSEPKSVTISPDASSISMDADINLPMLKDAGTRQLSHSPTIIHRQTDKESLFQQEPISERKRYLDKYRLPNPLLFPVVKILIGLPKIKAPGQQWVEVYIKNKTASPKKVEIRLLVFYPNGRVALSPIVKAQTNGNSLSNSIFTLPLGKYSGGVYKIQALVFDFNTHKLIGGSSTDLEAEFLVEGAPAPTSSVLLLGNYFSSRTKAGRFARLQFTDLDFGQAYALKDGNVLSHFALYNIGNQILENVVARFYLSNLIHPKTPITEALATYNFSALAPGERKEVNFNIALPPGLPLSEYILYATLENRENPLDNTLEQSDSTSASSLKLVALLPLSPADRQQLSANQTLLFQWEAPDLQNFFLEFSTEMGFNDQRLVVRLPAAGFLPANQLEVKEAEILMALAFARDPESRTVFWRVGGVSNTLDLVFSPTLSFSYQPSP